VTLEVVLRHRHPDFLLDVGFVVPATGVTALFGPSGAGKTLTLRHLAGLERADAGRITLGGRVLFDAASGLHLPPRARRVGLVFQDYALFPHLSVGRNVAYGLPAAARARSERVEALLDRVGLPGYGARGIRTLSGGERQRVALARALAAEPDLLLLDEPFAAVDFRVRRGLRRALTEIQQSTGVPMVLVTHALEDVRALADTLVLLDGGRVAASGLAKDLLDDPPPGAASELLGTRELT